MAKFTFGNGRSISLFTSVRRFLRPKQTGKLLSITVILGGFKDDYDDSKNHSSHVTRSAKSTAVISAWAKMKKNLPYFTSANSLR